MLPAVCIKSTPGYITQTQSKIYRQPSKVKRKAMAAFCWERFALPTAKSRFDVRPAILVLLLCFPALWPLWSVAFWSSHDGLHHIFRILDFDAALRSGSLYPRWSANLGFGYGFPVTQYYAPLAYFAA